MGGGVRELSKEGLAFPELSVKLTSVSAKNIRSKSDKNLTCRTETQFLCSKT